MTTFRNDGPGRILIPSLAVELGPGEEIDIPDAADAEPAPAPKRGGKKTDPTPEPQAEDQPDAAETTDQENDE